MSTKESLELNEITSGNPLLSSIRSIVETTFYGNNVHEVFDRKTAYQLAKGSPGTIITDLTISHAEELDLPADVRTLYSMMEALWEEQQVLGGSLRT